MSVEEIKSKLSLAMLQAAFEDENTGGSLKIAHLKGPSRKRKEEKGRRERPPPNILEKKTLEWYAVHFGSFLRNGQTIFVLYDKQQIGDTMLRNFFKDLVDDIGHVLAKVKGETLFVRRMLTVNDPIDLLARGVRENDLLPYLHPLPNQGLRRFVHDGQILYMVAATMEFLERLQVEDDFCEGI